jgi:hypothetical protein
MLALAIVACEQTPVSLPEATSIVANPTQMEMIAGDMTAASAHVLDQRSEVLRGAQVSWSSTDPAVARVSSDGMVTAVAPGSATLTASYGNLRTEVPVVVTRDDRDLISTLEITQDTVSTDSRAGPQWVSFRAFDGRGRHRCDASFQLRSSDRSVATASHTGGCQFRIEPVGPGQTTITVSANGASDSFVVNVTLGGEIAFYSDVPGPEAFFAGNTVTYRVRVINADDQPIAGHVVNFEVSHGRLVATSVRTDEAGYAVVQWRLPQQLRIRTDGYDYEHARVVFRTQLPSGAVESQEHFLQILPAAAATIRFLIASHVGMEWRLTPVSGSAQVPLGVPVLILVETVDQYGNRRDPWQMSMMIDSMPVFPWGFWIAGRRYHGIEHSEWQERTMTVTASDGDLTGSLQIIFTGGQ